jgi:hypothetical protein
LPSGLFDLEAVVGSVAELVAPAAAEKGIELAVQWSPDTPRRVVGDGPRFRQVLMNLTGNAVKFTSKGNVLIQVDCPERSRSRAVIRVAIKDTGIGLANWHAPAEFNLAKLPFAQEFLPLYEDHVCRLLGCQRRNPVRASPRNRFRVHPGTRFLVGNHGNILDVVEQRIRQADVVIADMSTRNANVFYEIGYARAVGRPTVLLCRNTDTVPFDLQSINYIKYGGIVELRERLEKRLRALADEQSKGPPE